MENRNGESGGLSGARLGLCDDIMTLHHGDDGTLLDGGRSLETAVLSRKGDGKQKKHSPVSVDPTKELRPKIHVVEAMRTEKVSGPDNL